MKLLEAGTRLAELVEQYRLVYDSSTDKWVGMGLMTKAEYGAFVNYRKIDSMASQAGSVAADAISMGEWLSKTPKAYRDLARRRDQITPELRKWHWAIKAAASFDGFNDPRELGKVGLRDSARALRDRLKAHPTYKALYNEDVELAAKLEPKEREGTLARQARQVASNECRRKMDQARSEAIEQYLVKYSEVVKAGKAAEQAMQRRIDKRRAALVAKMRDLLSEPIEEA